MTASMKQKTIDILWIIGVATVALIVISFGLRFAALMLNVEVNAVVQTVVGVIAAIVGGVSASQRIVARKRAD